MEGTGSSSGGQQGRNSTQPITAEDPKRLRRLMLNREYGQRCRQRKKEHLEQLSKTKDSLEAKMASLSSQVPLYEEQIETLKRENAALKQQLEEEELRASIDDAETSSLKMEKENLTWIEMIQQEEGDK